MNKVQVLSSFKEMWKECVESDARLAKDKPAVREAWNNYTDMLQKDGSITEKQYNEWSNPF